MRHGALDAEDIKWYDFIIKNVQEDSESFTFTYTAKDEKDINAFDEAFSTIVINEKQIEGKNDSLVTLGMCAVIVALILVGVIKFVIRTPYRKQQGNK